MFHVPLYYINNFICKVFSACPNKIINMATKNSFQFAIIMPVKCSITKCTFLLPAPPSTSLTLRYQAFGASYKPYTVINSFYKLFASTSLGF